MILLKIFLILLGLLILLLLGILIPKIWLTIGLRLSDDSKTGSARVHMAGKLIGAVVNIDWPQITVKGGIAGAYFSVWSGQPGKKAAKKKPPAPKKEEKIKVKKRVKHSTAEWIEFGKILLTRFLKIPRIEKFSANLVIGLGNPASTGLMMGAYYALKSSLNIFHVVQVIPDFVRKKINGEMEFCGSIRLIKTIPLIIFTLRYLWRK